MESRRRFIGLLASLSLFAAVPARAAPSAETVAKDDAAFARDLYGVVAKTNDDLFLGPGSISAALAMTWAGARGNTALELQKALHFSLPQNDEHEARSALLAKLTSTSKDSPRVVIANRLFAQTGYPFEAPFVKLTGDRYGAAIESLNFGDADGSRKIINAWVKSKTDDMIPELLHPGDVSGSTRLVLVNAMAFQAAWETPFRKDATTSDTFITKNGPKKVPTMHGDARAMLGDTKDAEVLSLPYASKDPSKRWSMVIVLPKGDAKPDLAAAFSAKLAHSHVNVALPKFKMRTHLDLLDAFGKLGVHDAFGSKADFSGISKKPLSISGIIHEAFVEVDEAGTKAAAATAVLMTEGAAMPSKTFKVDRPFTFAIRDEGTGATLFLGHVSDPKS